MNADDPRAKWHPIDPAAMQALLNSTTTPGVVYPVATSALPAQIQQMPGIASYYISHYTTGVPLANNVTAGGEMVVFRSDQGLAKGYNFIFGTSSNSLAVFNGPHYNFPAHHIASSSPVSVESVFGNVPHSKKSAP
jgi:hypothetical protein